MGLKLFWTDQALSQLEDIFDYYKVAATTEKAKDIVASIVEKTAVLVEMPRMGTKEELLRNRKHEYRYILAGHYKIIYWVDDSNSRIVVAAVFDSRQNPAKMKKIE